jgi:hypothetical protein
MYINTIHMSYLYVVCCMCAVVTVFATLRHDELSHGNLPLPPPGTTLGEE